MNRIGLLTTHLNMPGCKSLKEKRSQLKPLLVHLHREFNISVAEMGLQDKWSEAIIACAMLGNDAAHLQRSLATIQKWIEANWRDGQVYGDVIEIIQ
ncbi:MAG: hypothetical protein A2X25_11380 [Chloroflexi bacterium GWB2_49_20]|nr:MAG: hypothetical protein A2X25_11380 [Chloroflexi bacterium GWB2_49_20]OGN77612.1 MAG: hypothetical protein A2X26_09650 [Chloroflexi bacterium GWC2_49_37]OGN86388.1 MAG: hypothetical protein A2X27_05805 [Chloroflexi bacterium GWD2_49_16]HBG74626.1 DUF503 domain-containing protein [Anaerolineae bacterium]